MGFKNRFFTRGCIGCIEHVGYQIIDPKVDIGFDLSAEYAATRAMFGQGK